MSTPDLIRAFYERIWNAGDEDASDVLLDEAFDFRGSLGSESRGREPFLEYVRSVRACLAEYRCDILECVSEGDRAFAHMRFSGTHVGQLRGWEPTGLPVEWQGAALFSTRGGRICSLWVLGDLAALDATLAHNASSVGSAQQGHQPDRQKVDS